MAYPTPNILAPQTFATSASSWDIDMPAAVSVGDLLHIYIMLGANRGFAPSANEFTRLIEQTASQEPGRLTVFEKEADGDEGGQTLTFNSEFGGTAPSAVVIVAQYTEWTSSEISSSLQSADSNNSPDPPSFTPTFGSGDNLWVPIVGWSNDDIPLDSTATNNGYPPDYSNGISAVSGAGAGSGSGLGIATRELDTTTEDPGSFTLDGDEAWAAVTVCIQGTAGGGATGLSGSVDSSFSLSGDLSQQALLSGTLDNESDLSGNIIAQAALSGSLDTEAQLSGDLLKQALLAGDIQTASALSGAIVKQLSGQIESESSLSAELVKQALLSGSIDSESALSGNIVIVDPGITSLSGSVDTASQLSGSLALLKKLQGIIESQTALSGDLIKEVTLSGDIVTVSSLSADASIEKALSGTILVTSSLSGELTPVGAAWGGTIDITNSPLYSVSFQIKPMHNIAIEDNPFYTITIKVKDE